MSLISDERVITPQQFQPDGPENGVFEFASKSIPIGTTFVIGLIKRSGPAFSIEDYPKDELVVDYFVKISRDAGLTWNDLVDLQGEGGVKTNRDGSPKLWERHKIVNQFLNSDNPADANTRIKGSFKVHSQTSTEAWVEYWDDITHTLSEDGKLFLPSVQFNTAETLKSKI